MPRKNIYLLPGFGGSYLGDVAANEILWWNPSLTPVSTLRGLALSPDGKTPLPPFGVVVGVEPTPRGTWKEIADSLKAKLNPPEWQVFYAPYDWRLELSQAITDVANSVIAGSTPDFPATFVGHSMGGLVAVLAYAELAAAGKANLVRRVITICTPFQGSYLPMTYLTGTNAIAQQLVAVGSLVNVIPGFNPLAWQLGQLNAIALTWPSFYELFPYLGVPEAITDPNRSLFYNAAAYPTNVRPDQNWLNYSRDTFQPRVRAAAAFPPDYVLTTVTARGVITPFGLLSDRTPINLFNLGFTLEGDAIVSEASQTRSPGKNVIIIAEHWSAPVNLSESGLLAELIVDPRHAPDPPPPVLNIGTAYQQRAEAPPADDTISPILCIGGG